MAFTRSQIRDSIERAGDEHWQARIRPHEDAHPPSRPPPPGAPHTEAARAPDHRPAAGDVAKREAARLNDLGLGDNPDIELVESRVEAVPPAVRITHVFEDRAKGERFETDPYTGYE